MAVGWLYHRDFLLHDTGADHPERPERLGAIIEGLTTAGLLDRMVALPFDPAPIAAIERVHHPAYVELVRRACEDGFTMIGSRQTAISPRSFEVARLAAGAALAACDAAMAGRINRAFCAVRPPGHHATSDQAMGYCLFNNVAIAAEHLVHVHRMSRVAIVDIDVHHGNGTQAAFESRADVLYISLHQSPRTLFPGTGSETDAGTGAGQGFTLNIPFMPGADDRDYRAAFERQVIPALEAYEPQFLLMSTGFDALAEDRTANINLSPDCYGWMTRKLVQAAGRCCDGRLVSVLEGGYHLRGLASAAIQHVQALVTS
jgi:acetoin utilization deacetylase AcuC-like enzyme